MTADNDNLIQFFLSELNTLPVWYHDVSCTFEKASWFETEKEIDTFMSIAYTINLCYKWY